MGTRVTQFGSGNFHFELARVDVFVSECKYQSAIGSGHAMQSNSIHECNEKHPADFYHRERTSQMLWLELVHNRLLINQCQLINDNKVFINNKHTVWYTQQKKKKNNTHEHLCLAERKISY